MITTNSNPLTRVLAKLCITLIAFPYIGVHSVSEYPPVFTGCYDAVSSGSPQYELLPQCEAQPYEMPRKIDIYATLSSEATLASSSSTYFGTEPRDTIKVRLQTSSRSDHFTLRCMYVHVCLCCPLNSCYHLVHYCRDIMSGTSMYQLW